MCYLELITKYGEEDGMMIFAGDITEENYHKRNSLIEKYGEKYGQSVYENQVEIGMTDEMVKVSIGEPDKILIDESSYDISSTWLYYDEIILKFKNNEVVKIEEF